MKAILQLSILLFLFLTITTNAQDLQGTIGDGGDFIIYDHTTTPIFDLYLNSGNVRLDLGKTLAPTGLPIGSINVGDVSGTTSLNLSSFSGTGSEHTTLGPKIYFGKSRGISTNALTIADGDLVGSLSFWGNYLNSNNANTNYIQGAKMAVFVDGTVENDKVPMKIEFSTMKSGTSTLTQRLTINNDGTVNISNLAGSGTVNLQVDASGNLVRSAKSYDGISEAEIEALKQENAVLKARLADLEAKVNALLQRP